MIRHVFEVAVAAALIAAVFWVSSIAAEWTIQLIDHLIP